MAFDFFAKRRKKARKAQSGAGETSSTSSADAAEESVNQPATPPEFLPDHTFPELNRSWADTFRRELKHRFELHDASIKIEGTSATISRADGAIVHISLRRLALDTAVLPDLERLPELLDSFVVGALSSPSLKDYSVADIYRSLRIRLYSAPESDDESEDGEEISGQQVQNMSILRPFTYDMVIALVIDTEHAIRSVPLENLEEFDSLDILERAAERNTWSELDDAKVETSHIKNLEEGTGSDFWAFESSSYYLGSAPLFLNDFLRKWAPELDQSNGIIFAVPDRDLLLARPVTTGKNLMNGITAMVQVAMRFGLGNPTSISPRLHLLHESQVTTFTNYRIMDIEDLGQNIEPPFDQEEMKSIGIEIQPTPYLLSMLQQGDEFGESFNEGEY